MLNYYVPQCFTWRASAASAPVQIAMQLRPRCYPVCQRGKWRNQFPGFSRTTFWRHKPHMTSALVAAQVAHGDDLAGQVRDLIARARMLGERAEHSEDLRTAVAALR